MIELAYIYSVLSRAIVLCSVLIANRCTQLASQASRNPLPGHAHSAGENGARASFELRVLTERLSLTDEQRMRVRSELAEQQQEIEELHQAMRNDPNATGATDDKLRSIRRATDSKVAALLNDGQRAVFAVWVDERNAAIEHRRRRGEEEAPTVPDETGEPLSLI